MSQPDILRSIKSSRNNIQKIIQEMEDREIILRGKPNQEGTTYTIRPPKNGTPKFGTPENGTPKNERIILDYYKKQQHTNLSDMGPPNLVCPQSMLLLFSKKTALNLINTYGEKKCMEKIELAKQRKGVTNMPGLVIEALKNDWTTTEQLERQNLEQKKKQNEAEKARRVGKTLLKLDEGSYISQEEYELLPLHEQKTVAYDKNYYEVNRKWRYSRARF